MPGGRDEISLGPLRDSDLESIVTWRYGGEYTLYDLSAGDRATFTDPANEYLAIRRRDDLVGYVCLGTEARVAGMTGDPGLIDLGVGIRPDLTGQGQSRWLMPAILSALDRRLGTVTFRAVIKDWNERAQRAAEHAGFRPTGTHENDAGSWMLLERRAGQTA